MIDIMFLHALAVLVNVLTLASMMPRLPYYAHAHAYLHADTVALQCIYVYILASIRIGTEKKKY